MAKDNIKVGAKICDPACGVGKFLLEPVMTKLDQFYEIKKGKLIPKITINGYDKGFDKDEQKTIILAKANMLIYFSDLVKDNPGLTTEFSKLFNDSFFLKTNSILGTLSEPVENEYDLIITNPPYVTSGSSNLKEEIKKDGRLVNYYKVNAMGVEGLFMEWIINALKPNGKAFIIVPDGLFNRQNDKNLRQFIIDECFIDGIISLPIKTFFTTPKKTYIFCITKKPHKNTIQTDPVFTYLVSEMGESRDVYRFDIEQDDLREAVSLYSFFKGNKSGFEKINTDLRCKIQQFQTFKPENHWSIDRWWTKEEKIKLGILEEEKTIDVNEFSVMISDISETLKDFSGILQEVSEKKKKPSRYVEISLNDGRYFNTFIGKRIIKRDLVKISGAIPIYSSNVKEPIGYHTDSNLSDFSSNFVIWGIDGYFEYNYIRKGHPFATTDHCGAIRILDDKILPEYLMIQLEKIKYKYGFDRELRASLKNMREVFVEIPYTNNNEIDVEKQQEIIEKYQLVSELKSMIQNYKKKVEELNIELKEKILSRNSKIKDLFDLKVKTNNSQFTKTFIDKNKGTIPVYSASKFSDTVDYGYVQDNLLGIKYFENCLTWNIDGSIGKVYFRHGRFSLSEKVIPLVVQEEFNGKVDLLFLKYTIEAEFSKNYFGFDNKAGKGKIQNIEISIPVDDKGLFDLLLQKQIAEKHLEIEQIKKNILEELDKIFDAKIDFE